MSAARDITTVSYLLAPEATDLLDTLSTGVVVLDAQLRLRYANVSAQGLMAVSLRHASGKPFADLFYDSQPLKAVLQRSLAGQEICTQHELQIKPVGTASQREACVVDLVVAPLESSDQQPLLLLELIDVAARQRLSRDRDLLAEMDASRLMIRQLAHEVKNPLGGLRGAAQLLEKELDSPALREYTTVIINEADRLAALVDSMVGSARPARKEQLNIHEVCEHVLHLLRAEAPAGVVIDRDYDPSLPDGVVDRHQMVQALLNIARNALQAVGTGGHITLRTRARSAMDAIHTRRRLVAVIEVEDNGPGVPLHLMKTLFMPLVTGRNNGTGLGLAVAQDLVMRHGGIVEFTSEAGRTVFSLLLPLEGSKE
jgi:two-component system, NtrC family, nitrogen regulation sensor histidine kinase GlnL